MRSILHQRPLHHELSIFSRPSPVIENDYTLNPIFEILLAAIEPGSKEKEVQAMSENVLWTVYPASKNFSTLTKCEHGAIEPDNIIRKIVQFYIG